MLGLTSSGYTPFFHAEHDPVISLCQISVNQVVAYLTFINHRPQRTQIWGNFWAIWEVSPTLPTLTDDDDALLLVAIANVKADLANASEVSLAGLRCLVMLTG